MSLPGVGVCVFSSRRARLCDVLTDCLQQRMLSQHSAFELMSPRHGVNVSPREIVGTCRCFDKFPKEKDRSQTSGHLLDVSCAA